MIVTEKSQPLGWINNSLVTERRIRYQYPDGKVVESVYETKATYYLYDNRGQTVEQKLERKGQILDTKV